MAAYLFYGCWPYHRMEMGAGLTKQIKENTSFSTTELSSKKTRPSLPKCVLVLLHGLTMDASECNAIKKTVEDYNGLKNWDKKNDNLFLYILG